MVKGFRMHTASEYQWIAEKNFYNAVCYYLPMLEKIKRGEHLSTWGELFSKRERLRLKRMGVIDYRQSGKQYKSGYTLTRRTESVMGSLRASMPNP